jgi:hypothetical protein
MEKKPQPTFTSQLQNYLEWRSRESILFFPFLYMELLGITRCASKILKIFDFMHRGLLPTH